MTSREQFQKLFSTARVDLAHAALLSVQIIKQDSTASVTATSSGLSQIDELAGNAAAAGCESDIHRLVAHLGGGVGLSGNTDNYYDPDNSDLSCVLKNKTGIPITLAIIYIEVGQRLGFDLRGIGFPGHFLLGHYDSEYAGKNGDREQALIDPFVAQLTSRDESLERLWRGQSQAADDHAQDLAGWLHRQPKEQIDSWFRPASPQATILRLLENLKQIYAGQSIFGGALAALELQLLLAPSNFELRDQQRALLARVAGESTAPKIH